MANFARLHRRFADSCGASLNYPSNLVFPTLYKHQLSEYLELLNRHQQSLFGTDTAIDFLEFENVGDSKSPGMRVPTIRSSSR